MEDLVSIITPVHNGKKYIKETIDSVLSQTYSNWELIIVDDCSSDGVLEYIKEHYDDARIKIFSNKQNKGAGKTRNTAISKASGRFLAFLDSDDVWLPTKLEKQIKFMDDNDYKITYTDYVFIDEGSKKIRGRTKVREYIDLSGYMKYTDIGFSTSIMDLSVINKPKLSEMKSRHDAAMWMYLLRKGYKAYGLQEVLGEYRIRENSVSSNKIKSAYKLLKIYLREKSVPFYKRLYYWLFYVFNASLKRLRK